MPKYRQFLLTLPWRTRVREAAISAGFPVDPLSSDAPSLSPQEIVEGISLSRAGLQRARRSGRANDCTNLRNGNHTPQHAPGCDFRSAFVCQLSPANIAQANGTPKFADGPQSMGCPLVPELDHEYETEKVSEKSVASIAKQRGPARVGRGR